MCEELNWVTVVSYWVYCAPQAKIAIINCPLTKHPRYDQYICAGSAVLDIDQLIIRVILTQLCCWIDLARLC